MTDIQITPKLIRDLAFCSFIGGMLLLSPSIITMLASLGG